MSDTDGRPWTVAEAAAFLHRDPETVRRWARSGRLAGAKDLGGDWRFRPEVIRAAAGEAPAPELSERAQEIAVHVQAARAKLRMIRGR